MITRAKWITSPKDTGEAADSFVRKFNTPPDKTVKLATLYASSMGVYAPFFNGLRVGAGVLAPGWTSYKTRVQYQTYDITSLIRDENEIYIGVGQGWALGQVGVAEKSRYYYADRKSVIALIHIEYTDGACEEIITDTDWECYSTEVTYSDIYHGETVDLSRDIEYLGNAIEYEVKSQLIPQIGEDITEQERLHPIALIITPKGERVLDFGQNMTGYVEMHLKAKRGEKTVIHHAEVLDREGNFYTENYRSARNENVYISSGELDVFKPTYTFQGFRYIRLTEYPKNEIDLSSFVAIAVNSNLKRTGKYHTGNPKINQLYHNIIWGQKSNYLDIPTDCPQRDERLGWTGDAQVFCRTAAINFDVERFFEKWLGDVAIEQKHFGGAVAGIVPRPRENCYGLISAAWGDVACIAPWEIYLAYGNSELLEKNYPMMKDWVDYLRGAGPEEYLWLGGHHFGDWLALDSCEDSYVGATSKDLIASAYFARSTELLVKAGRALGKDMTEYENLYENIKTAFQSYFMENGMPKSDIRPTRAHKEENSSRSGRTQTALSLILKFGLCKDCERAAIAKELNRLVEENGMRMNTGFVGTPYILHALSENGYTDTAYSLLLQEKAPSWLFSVNHGATTMWEHWDSLKEDGSFWSADMNSFNHYAYGAVFDWMFGVSSGITPAMPGYREINIEPHPNKALGYADASIETRHGTVRSYWYYKDGRVCYEIEIPDGVLAHLALPDGRKYELSCGKYIF